VLWAFQTITVYSQQAALLLMGAMLLCTVMVAPQGFVIGVVQAARRLFGRRRPSKEPTVPAASTVRGSTVPPVQEEARA
jgi:urea transport system permease protein